MVDDDADQFIKKFRKHLGHTSEFIQTLLNAHLEVEGDLDTFLDQVFLNPEYLEKARLSFYQKVQLCRAYSNVNHDAADWKLMDGLNALRNKVAHRSRHKVLKLDLRELRGLIEERSERLRSEMQGASNIEVVVHAAALCSGFLSFLLDNLKRAQGLEVDDDE
jgi:hypothetical protein